MLWPPLHAVSDLTAHAVGEDCSEPPVADPHDRWCGRRGWPSRVSPGEPIIRFAEAARQVSALLNIISSSTNIAQSGEKKRAPNTALIRRTFPPDSSDPVKRRLLSTKVPQMMS